MIRCQLKLLKEQKNNKNKICFMRRVSSIKTVHVESITTANNNNTILNFIFLSADNTEQRHSYAMLPGT